MADEIGMTLEAIKQQLTHWRTELAFRISGSVHYTEEAIEEARTMVRRLQAMKDQASK